MGAFEVAVTVLFIALLATVRVNLVRRFVFLNSGEAGPGWRTIVVLLSLFCAAMGLWTGAVEREFLWALLWAAPLPLAVYTLITS